MKAQENFKLTLESGKQINVRLELCKSGAFEYGNGTCVAWYDDDNFRDSFDTRYESGCSTPESFHEWSLEFVKSQVRKTVRVERA